MYLLLIHLPCQPQIHVKYEEPHRELDMMLLNTWSDMTNAHHNTLVWGDSTSHLPDIWSGMMDQRMSFLPDTWTYQVWIHQTYSDSHLNVTTACKVVLLPSNHPFGRIPGDPQLISIHLVWDMTSVRRVLPLHIGCSPVQTLFLSHLRTVSPMIM